MMVYAGDGEGYMDLKHLRVGFDEPAVNGEGFILAFWLYLSGSTHPPSTILYQVSFDAEGKVPFLSLSAENKLILFPSIFLHKEAPACHSSFPWIDLPQITSKMNCPLERWFHIGCEIDADNIRLTVDGTLVGEKSVTSLSEGDLRKENLKRGNLVGSEGDEGMLQGFIYKFSVLSLSVSIADHYSKDPPIKLCFDASSLSDGIEVADDGVWSIVGGKASCRRIFSMEVVLLDALGGYFQKEMEIFASLIYADNGHAVEKVNDDAEDPLLISYDGVELPSTERPTMAFRGRATFKLKISKLSSKSDNRLFRVCFRTICAQRFPFFEAFTPSIRCISRNRCFRQPVYGRRPNSSSTVLGASHTHGVNDSAINNVHCGNDQSTCINPCETKYDSLLKRLKVGHNSPATTDSDGITLQNERAINLGLEEKIVTFTAGGTDSASDSDSESYDTGDESQRTRGSIKQISDALIFRYCLEGTFERSMLLKEIVYSSGSQDIEKFAEQVCLYTGCHHHWDQILISKQLVQEGAVAWSSLARSRRRVLWTDVIHEMDRRFRGIACSNRGLSMQDLQALKIIAGCGEEMSHENFEKMWCWLYPVAFALSRDQLNALWDCSSRKWIEGFITKEEAENSLKDSSVLPGTFVLRFPTSRSWPHPDSGCLVVTYLGNESTIHHKLLSADYRCDRDGMRPRPLQELLLEEPELSYLGRVTREEFQQVH